MEELLSPEEVGERLGVSVYTVRRWIKEGKLRAFKPGKEYRVRVADLEEFFAAREVHPKVEAQPSEYGPGWRLEVSYWIACLTAQADLSEHIIASGDYDLEGAWKLEGAAVEFWGSYSRTVRKSLRESGSPGQQEQLQQAEERMKAARTATRQAYRERREAEQDRQKVIDLDARRQAREERYTDHGHADTGS